MGEWISWGAGHVGLPDRHLLAGGGQVSYCGQYSETPFDARDVGMKAPVLKHGPRSVFLVRG